MLAQLATERLEPRTLLTAYHWDGGTSGDFDVASNWADSNDDHAVPGPNDDITVSGGVTVDVTASATVNSVNGDSGETFDVTAGTFTINNANSTASTLGALDVETGATFQLAAGAMTLNNAATIAGMLDLGSGATLALTGGGTYNLNSGAAFSGAGGCNVNGEFTTLDVNADVNGPQDLALSAALGGSGTLTLPGTFEWTGGSIGTSTTVDLAQNATLQLGSSNAVTLNGTLDNLGTINWTGAADVDGTGTLDNESDGTFNIENDQNFFPDLTNGGTLNVQAGSGASLLRSGTFDNTGTLDVQTGIFSIYNNGTSTGAFDVASGATLQFTSDNGTTGYTIGPGATFTSAGLVSIVGGFDDVIVDTDITIPDLTLSAGLLDGSGDVTVTGTLDWTGGTMQGTGTTTIPQGATLDTFENDVSVNLTRTLDSAGTIDFAGSGYLGANGTINNTGTITVSAGTGTASLTGTALNDVNGQIDVQSGTLQTANGSDTGTTYSVATGATLLVQGAGFGGADGFTLGLSGTVAGSGGGSVVFGNFGVLNVAQGGATLDFPGSMFQWTGPTINGSASLTIAGNLDWTGGTVQGTSTLTVAPGATLDALGQDSVGLASTLDNNGTINLQAAGAITGNGTLNNNATLNAAAGSGTIALDGIEENDNGASVNVASGTLQVGAGESEGTTYTVSNGANLLWLGAGPGGIDGYTRTIAGTITGTGAGSVTFGIYGILLVGLGGATLNFPGAMLQWNGVAVNSAAGNLTNQGTITLSGPNENEFFDDGTFDDFGTIVQAGTGNFGLHSDNVTPTTLKIEPGGSYLIEADSGFDNPNGGQTAVINAGTLSKTAGTGTSTLTINGTLTNTGTIEADSGTLALAPTSIAEVSGTLLTGGTWNALNGATLAFPASTNLTQNAGNVTLGGAGATIAAIGGLSANSGSLALTGGATLTTTGAFTNSGTLTVGAGSTLSVNGALTLTASSAVDDQVGGAPASGAFGLVSVNGTATIAGALNVALTGGYAPSTGQTYTVLSYTQATGQLSAFNESSPFFTEAQGTTSLTLNAAANPVDLSAASVSAPTTAIAGQSITVNWQVDNPSANAASGSWQDGVYLSPTDGITSSAILLGTVTHTGGLAAGGSYDGTLTTAIPAVAPGTYYVLVEVDRLYDVGDLDRANNTRAADTGQIAVSVPALTPGTPLTGSFTTAAQDQYFQVTVPTDQTLQFSLTSSAGSGALALYVSQGVLPTPYDNQDASALPNQPNQSVTVPQVLAGGTYYVLVQSVSGAAASAGFTLTATQTGAVTVGAESPSTGGNAGNVTVALDGTNFTPATTASLALGATTIHASSIDYINSSQIYATFNLTGAAVGGYTLSVQQGSSTVNAPGVFQVTAGSVTPLQLTVSMPQLIRSGRTGTFVISYTNTSRNDIVAPLLNVTSTNANVFFSTPDDPNNFVSSTQILAVAPNGPAGILRPGESGQLTLTLLDEDTTNGDQLPVEVQQNVAGKTIDWSAQKAALQPIGFTTAAWNAVWPNLLSILGTTTDSLNAAEAQAATYLSGLGETTAEVSDVARLWSFLVSQANDSFPTATLDSAVDATLPIPGSLSLSLDRTFVSSLAGRNTAGIFGLGWVTSWQTSLSTDSAGDVSIESAGGLGYFVLQPNGTYLDTDGETGTLTLSGGTYTFTNPSGTQEVFLASGQLSDEQDANGNRITLGYNGQRQLVSLTYANPGVPSEPTEQLTLSYNAQGFVSQVADSAGDSWAYAYDSAGHLLSVTAPGGLTTSYTYESGANPNIANALLSITSPNGLQQTFAYDALGRLSSASQNGGAEAVSYAYGGEAEVTVTDSAGDQTTFWYNDLGVASRVADALGAISNALYDSNGDLISYTNAAGAEYQYSYDANGDVTQTVNPLGQTTEATYGALDELTSLTDAAGNTTSYTYGTTGNLLSITYPDGTGEAFTYDPLGDLTETIEQIGDPVSQQSNAQGLIAQETFADGTSESFTYDAFGDILTAQTYSANGTLTLTTTLAYNAAHDLTSITYPNGQFLHFTYNTQGQRTQSVDQDGFTVNYSYDALGRLAELTDGSGNMIVTYSYNSIGQLVKKLNGNGTSTTYAYDANGDLTQEVNYAPGGTTVNSGFTYTYNVLGEITSVTDATGATTSYGYDALGELTSVTLPGGQTTTYVYNATGDLTETISGGTTTSATSNADNEITQVGSATYTYDANGNLASVTDASGTTTYTYNDQNELVSIAAPGGAVTTFQYSPLGFLVGQNSGGTQTNYLVDPTGVGNVVATYNGSGTLTANYVYGLGLVSQTGPSGTGYYDFDGDANTVGITSTNGNYVNQYSYLPFGQTTVISAALPNPFTFAGQAGVIQVGADLFSMRARFYSPTTGQFLSNDPLGMGGGSTNVREYVGNNPVNGLDPTGLYALGASAQAVQTKMHGSNTFIIGGGLGSGSGDMSSPSPIILPPGGDGSTQSATPTPVPPPEAQVQNYDWPPSDPSKLPPPPLPDPDNPPSSNDGPPVLPPDWDPNEDPITQMLRRVNDDWHREHDGDDDDDDDDNGEDGGGDGEDGGGSSSGDGGGGGGGGGGSSSSGSAHDPNALVGPAGYGAQEFVGASNVLPYTVDFENDGNLAAQDVTVSEQLSASLDWSTVQLSSFGFGPINVSVPAGLSQYQTTVPYQDSDGSALNVLVNLDFNVDTGLLTATFTSLDPSTGQAPTGVFDGFLPPNNSANVGQGDIEYTARPKSGLATGTTISAQVSVVFDINAPIATATVTNTIDAGAPTSSVAALPATVGASFPVSWTGTDDSGGSGVASYTVYVSDNGGPFTPWLTDTTQTSATYNGAYGHAYAFYSVATDNVGNVQATPASAQTSTQVVATPLQVLSISPSADFLTSLPSNQIVVTFNRALTGLVPDKTDGTGFASSPFAVMLIPSGPDGLATQKSTGVFWSAPSGYDSGDLPIPATAVYHVNANGTSTITLTPDQPLATDIYLITVNSVSDTYGDPLAINAAGTPGNVYASFDYRPSPVNHTAPTVTGVSTRNGTVAINNSQIPQPDTIAIAFSKPMDTYTINSSTVQLFEKGVNGALAAAVTYSPTTQSAYLTPEVKLEPGALYYVSVSTGVTDDQGFPSPGDPLANAFVTSFTVSGNPAGSGSSPLTVKQTDPVNGTAWTASLGYGAVTFSEPINLSSLTRFSAMLVPQSGSAVRGANAYADVPVNAQIAFNPGTNQLIIVPTGLLRNDTIYLFELSGITATNGNTLAGTAFSTFLLNTATAAHAVAHGSESTASAAVVTPAPAAPAGPTVPVRHESRVSPVLPPARPAQAVLTKHVPSGPRRFFHRR